MEIGTNAPSEELLKKWYSDIERFPDEVNSLTEKQARYLKRHISYVHRPLREEFCHSMLMDYKDELNQIFENYLITNTYNWSPIDDKEREQAENAVSMGDMALILVMEYIHNIDAFLMDELATYHNIVIERIGFDEIYKLDEKNRYITGLIDEYLEELNRNMTSVTKVDNSPNEKDTCKSKLQKTSAIFVYSMVRFFSDYLELNISPTQYKYASHGGKYIGETIFAKIPKEDIKGDKPTITDLATELYRHVYHDNEEPRWDLQNGKDRFNQKFKGVIELHPTELKKIEDCITEHKLEIIASYKN